MAEQHIDMKPCAKVEPPHICDDQPPCDPNFQENECPIPHICHEKLKNPAWPGEITRCKSGAFMHVKTCEKKEPPHPCDTRPPCSLKSEYENSRKKPCREPPLCMERVKNPDMKNLKPFDDCDPSK